jgi:hypothetical protein
MRLGRGATGAAYASATGDIVGRECSLSNRTSCAEVAIRQAAAPIGRGIRWAAPDGARGAPPPLANLSDSVSRTISFGQLDNLDEVAHAFGVSRDAIETLRFAIGFLGIAVSGHQGNPMSGTLRLVYRISNNNSEFLVTRT